MSTRREGLFTTLLAAALAVGCSGLSEESVNPGINAAYQQPEVGEWVERFEAEGREVYDHRQALVDECGLLAGQDAVDVGTGTGLFMPLLAEAVGPEGTLYAVDIVPEFVEHVGTRAVALGLAQVEARLCGERSVDLDPGSVDLAFVCDVYHHFEYPMSSLASIRDALRPGGKLVIVDFERIPGVSSDWVLGHVRAGKQVVIAEVRAAGFGEPREIDLLQDNYALVFPRD